MGSNKTLSQKKTIAQKTLKRLQSRDELTDKEVERQYKALYQLADANIKTMTVSQANEWAKDILATNPKADQEFVAWVWRMVGRTEQASQNKRGPREGFMTADVPEGYDAIVMGARKRLRIDHWDLKAIDWNELATTVNALRGLMPKISQTELRKLLRRLKSQYETKGS